MFLGFVYRIIKGRPLKVDPLLSSSSVIANAFWRGFFPAIRGLVWRVFGVRARGLLFVGANTNIINCNLLTTGPSTFIGAGSYIDCLSAGGITLGERVTFRESAWIQLTSSYERPGAELRVDDNVYVGPRCVMGAAAPIWIQSNCQLGANVSLVAENHKFSGNESIHTQGVTREGIVVEEDCWIGNNVIILDGVVVGRGSVIGAGAVITRSVPEYSVVVGNPGRVIRTRKTTARAAGH